MELHRRAWYLRSDEVIVTCDLQKSQYGPVYYLNVGFYLRAYGEEAYPKSHVCDIVVRAGQFLGEETNLDELLDLESGIPDEERIVVLYAVLSERLGPPMKTGASIAGLRAMLADGTLPDYMLNRNAQEALRSDTG